MQDIQLIERVKQQKLEMIKYLEAQIRDIEDDYLDKTLTKYGNVFNGWNQIKAGGTGFTSMYATAKQIVTKARGNGVNSNQNKRIRKLNDKDKDKEKIYVPTIMDEKSMRLRQHEISKIDFLTYAQKITDSKPIPNGRQSRNSKATGLISADLKQNAMNLKKNGSANNNSSTNGQTSVKNTINLTNLSNQKIKEPESANSNVRKSSRIKI